VVERFLTDRQLRVVRLFCAGATADEIAQRFGVGVAWVKLALLQSRNRLNVDSAEELCQALATGREPTRVLMKSPAPPRTPSPTVRVYASLEERYPPRTWDPE
jgi:DNA-binding CsgD family transcriptional regulator